MAISCPPGCIKDNGPLWELYDVTDDNPEFCLYDSIVSEYVDIAGFPVMYYRAKSKMDRLYGEDSNQTFYEPVKTKLYYEPTDEPNIIDMFGIRSDETLEYTLIPKSIFNRDVIGTVQGVPSTLTVNNTGTGYKSKSSVPVTGGSGEGLRVDITAGDSGSLTKVKINSFNKGFGYIQGDEVTISFGNSDATFIIDTVGVEDPIPMPGDVIKTLWNNRNYEIVDVGAESNIFMAKKLIWEFILRPFRFSEQSLKAEEIHRSSPAWNYIYIYPDGEFADIMYPDGTEVTGVAVDTLDIDLSVLECGYKYKRNEDGSVEVIEDTMIFEEDDSEDTHMSQDGQTGDVKDGGSRRYGDNVWIEEESDEIDDYGDIDNIMFVKPDMIPIAYGVSSNTSIDQSDIDDYTSFIAYSKNNYDLTLTLNDEYINIIVPLEFNDPLFKFNNFTVDFVETTGSYVIRGNSYTCRVYRSLYKNNGKVVVNIDIPG